MKTVLLIGASSSKHSINKRLATYAGSQLVGVQTKQIDLNDFEMPLYSVDREETNGIPQQALHFRDEIQKSDGIIISFAEHNGSYTAAFKNILDWASRAGKSLWNNAPMLLLATSPGGRGAQTVLNLAVNYFPHMGARITSHFSLPSFYDHFSEEKGILSGDLNENFSNAIQLFQKTLKAEKVIME